MGAVDASRTGARRTGAADSVSESERRRSDLLYMAERMDMSQGTAEKESAFLARVEAAKEARIKRDLV